MDNLCDPQTVISFNERSLARLVRAIALSKGQFSLVLVRCNSTQLKQQILQHLQQHGDVKAQQLLLSNPIESLYTAIAEKVKTCSPTSLSILGLESLQNLNQVLSSTNQVRDEFRKQFNFPIILWITDDVAIKLIRLAPDFKSWAAATIKFELATRDLLAYLKLQGNTLFALAELKIKEWQSNPYPTLKPSDSLSFSSDFAIGSSRRRELELHWKDLKNRGYELEPALEACRQFIVSQDYDAKDQSEIARQYYQQSLAFLQHESRLRGVALCESGSSASGSVASCCHLPNLSKHQQCLIERQGIVLFHIALTYRIQATRNPSLATSLLQEAQTNFQQSQEIFQQAGRLDLVAGVLSHLGEILQRLHQWEPLERLALEGVKMHITYGMPRQLAQDYMFMAEAALKQANWRRAHELTKLALAILPESEPPGSRGQYLLLLARCYQYQGQWQQALDQLNLACFQTEPKYNPQLYLEILTELRTIYYQLGHYRQAFRIKKKQREVEHQYGFRAFIGAARLQPPKQAINPSSTQGEKTVTIAEEMMASCRQQDIQNLIQRLSRDDHKLIIIHGRSGVGKSSLVNAGLVPALKNTSLAARNCLPVIVQGYTNWIRDLERSLAQSLLTDECYSSSKSSLKELWYQVVANPYQQKLEEALITTQTKAYQDYLSEDLILNPSAFVLQQLHQNAEQNLLTVLIFDQFEEFFFVSSHPKKRKIFYEFLQIVLNLPFVKVVLSLREDYLHYLLECDDLINLEAINNNILDKKIRYHLRDFTLAEAKAVIERLTQRAKLELEPALIDALVKDLADERQEVRPIELQVVGAQLQEEGEHGITTLAQYQQLGIKPKAELIKHSIEQVIRDCGPENEAAAWEILFALTDEKLTRPIKTKAELMTVARCYCWENQKITLEQKRDQFQIHHLENSSLLEEPESFLDVILESGLLLRRREEPEDCYQLLHDYLVFPIRERYALNEQQRQTEIKQRLNQAQAEKWQAQKALEKLSREQLVQRNQRLQRWLCVSLVVTGLLGFSAKVTHHQKQRADQQKQFANLATLTASSEALFFSQYKFDSLMESLRAARQFQALKRTSHLTSELTTMETRIAATLQQSVYGTEEHNRLESHQDMVWDVAFSPTGEQIASASVDKTIKIWTPKGQLLRTLIGHNARLASISFSPTSETLVSASQDGIIKIWPLQLTGSREPISIKAHQDSVSCVTFSPDGRFIASVSEDQTLKLWTAEGELIRTLWVSATPLKWVSFSPDSQVLAVASDEGTVKIMELDGTIVYNLRHSAKTREKVYAVSFSPDGRWIATVGADQTLKLWTRRGRLVNTLKANTKVIFGVKFSPDSKLVATASEDKSIHLWTVEGTLLKRWQGHGDKVTNISFSPDGKVLASSSYDKTVKLWSLDQIPLETLSGHQHRVLAVSFSPNGQLLASASHDKTVKLWSRNGILLTTLYGHQDRVIGVSFSPDGQLLATTGYDRTVKLWNVGNKDQFLNTKFPEFLRPSFIVPVSPLKSIKPLKSWIAHDDSIMGISFSPDGKQIATASKDKTIKIWSADGQLLQVLTGHQGWVNSVAFSPDSQMLASGGEDGLIKFWDREGKLLKTIEADQGSVWSVSFSPDHQVLASAGYDNTVKIWDRNGYLLNTLLKGSSDSATSVTFSPDSQLIASASFDGTAKLWSRHDGTLLKTLVGHRDSVMGVSFSPDGRILASASRDQTLILWNLDLENLIDQACHWVEDYLKTNPKVRKSDRNLCNI